MLSTATATTTMTTTTTLVPHSVVLKVPLALGTLQWGTTWVDDKVINSKGGVLTEDTVHDILSIMTKSGVTLLDTAEGYGGGTSEKRCGRLMASQQAPSNGEDTTTASHNNNSNGDKILIMTKFLPAPWRLFHSDLERAVRGSCRRLNVATIDVYLLHSPVHWCRPIEYWIEAGAKCHRLGLIRSMGLSNCNADQVRRAVKAGKEHGVPVVCNQVHYSLLDYNSHALQEMHDACKELNVKVIGFSPIGQGLLTDRGMVSFDSNKPARMLRLKREDLHVLRAALADIAAHRNKTMAQVALNWCIQHDVIPLVGCRSPQQATDSVGCLGWSLSPSEVERLDRVALDRSTLESPSWRRMLFVSLFAGVMVVCRTLDALGFGSVVPIKAEPPSDRTK